ncbi:MAG: hypothetical protein VB085_07750 [Peptococcaceae bacterium]|nr:hypothetical protein [Peptococcaceae bacterium]
MVFSSIDVVVTDGVLLPWNDFETADQSKITAEARQLAENVASVAAVAESYGGSYYYVGVPCQYVFYEDAYPPYLNSRREYTEASIAAVTTALDNAGINFIDMGLTFKSLGWADYLTSAIDNHFSIYGAYLTYLAIMEQINEDTGLDLTIMGDGDGEITELPNQYLGSRTRKLFNLWQNGETLSILTPTVSVPFTRTDNGVQAEPTVYSMPSSQWDTVLYWLYMGGDVASTVIDTGREELPSILIYGDSFTNAVECIMYYGFNTMYSLDMRHYKGMSLGGFINEYQPDIVVCIRDYQAIISTDYNGKNADWVQ